MAFSFHGFIGAEPALNGIRMRFPAARIIALGQELFLIPLTDALQRQMNGSGEAVPVNGFELLTGAIEEAALVVSEAGPLSYAEVLQWTGEGSQAAIMWEGGLRVRTFRYGQDLINRILRTYGAIAGPGQDEFTALGFAARRFTDDWLREG
ncbi:hypothetical protein [Flaviaesturariibacter amylovorans]|uniref:Uncharacterized protein n=1 Tax=Flaviaesturariibacter amylovorans TaxID=1084520 RepID=A0ABP8GXM2_9BACT